MPGEVPSQELSLKYVAGALKYDIAPAIKTIATELSEIRNLLYLSRKPAPVSQSQSQRPPIQRQEEVPF